MYYTHRCKIQLQMYYNKEKRSVFGNVPYRIVLLNCCFTELRPANGNKGLIELPETQCCFPEIHGEIYFLQSSKI